MRARQYSLALIAALIISALPLMAQTSGSTSAAAPAKTSTKSASSKSSSSGSKLDINAATADQDHAYSAEQMAFDGGSMDLFPLSVGAADGPGQGSGPALTNGLTMGYFDGNTVTAMWNYAQHFALSDNSYNTTFGPSTPGALNLIDNRLFYMRTPPPSSAYQLFMREGWSGPEKLIFDPRQIATPDGKQFRLNFYHAAPDGSRPGQCGPEMPPISPTWVKA